MSPANDQSNSGFSVSEVKCPACGAPLALPDGAQNVTCGYCGASIHVKYGPQQQEPVGIEEDGTIRDRGSGNGLFRVKVPSGWHVRSTSLMRRTTVSHPYIPCVGLKRGRELLELMLGDAGTRYSTSMKALMATYGSAFAHVDRANYAEMPDPIALADEAARHCMSSINASDFKFVMQYSSNNLERRQQEALSNYKGTGRGQGLSVASPFAAEVLRTYSATCAGEPWKMASYVRLCAVKMGTELGNNLGTNLSEGLGNLFGGMGGALLGGMGHSQGTGQVAPTSGQQPSLGQIGDFIMGGGLLGKMRRDRQAAAQQQHQQPQQQMPQQQPPQQPQTQQQPQAQRAAQQPQAQQPTNGAVWCAPDFAEYCRTGSIIWSVDGIATFAAPANEFDAGLKDTFFPFANSFVLHPDVIRISLNEMSQHDAQIQSATNARIQQDRARTQQHLQMMQQQQAAYDSYNESWRRNSDAQHQAFRARTNAQFGGSYGGTSAPDFSEAIRGVNTFTTSDGCEVELSINSDRAWENQAGDVIGGSGGFDPGADWTEIPRT